jgi:tRNA (cytosine38-C5)-methyltransferase
VEFYSGIGGWSYAAEKASEALGLSVKVIAAFDVSTTCNAIYESNLGLRPSQRPIEKLTLEELDSFQADLWMMSPPCQPHTRQRNNETCRGGGRDSEDARAASFLHLCELLPNLRKPPCLIALENVVGFESSECAAHWRSALASAGYCIPKEWHLTPTMIGVPNERPRYYGLATRRSLEAIETLDTSCVSGRNEIMSTWPDMAAAGQMVVHHIDSYLELPLALDGPDEEPEWLKQWLVPSTLMEKDSSWCFDIVSPVLSSKDEPSLRKVHATTCFTHSYGRFIRGTGSVLYVPPSSCHSSAERHGDDGPDSRLEPESREFGQCWKDRLHSGGGKLRYFTPREVANLLGFPRSQENANATSAFNIPAELSTTRAWAALGNSIHIGTAAAVLKHGLQELFLDER